MSENPYQAPEAIIENAVNNTDGYDEHPMLSPSGRLNRSRYLVYSLGFAFLFFVVAGILLAVTGGLGAFMGDPEAMSGLGGGMLAIMLLLFIPLIVISVIFMIKRLHDMDMSGWWSILFFILAMVPIISLFSYAFLYLKPGTPGANRFAAPGKPNSTIVKVFTWIFGIFMALAVVGSLFSMVMAITSGGL